MKKQTEKQTIFFFRCNGCAFSLTKLEESVFCFSRRLLYSARPEKFLSYLAKEETVECGEAVRDELLQLLERTQLLALCGQIETKVTQDTRILEGSYLEVSCKPLQLDLEAGVYNYPELENPDVQLRLAQLIVQLSSLFTIVQQHQYPFNEVCDEARHGKAFEGLLKRYFG